MDAAPDATQFVATWAQSGIYGEGQFFLGYPYLSELAQRPEYRHIAETIAGMMTSRWVRLVSSGGEDKTDRIKKLEALMRQFDLQSVFRRAARSDGLLGMGMVFIDLGVTDDPDELASPLVRDAAGVFQRGKIGRNTLRGFVPVEPTWVTPERYNSTDPLKSNFMVPDIWYVMGKRTHASRLLIVRAREVPDIIKASYNFGGLSLSQMAKPYVDNWLRTRQSVSDLLHSFSTFVLKTDWNAVIANVDVMNQRTAAFILGRDNKGLMTIDKETEDVANIAVPLGTLDRLLAQSQEQMASVSQLTLIHLLGITPSGLNATADSEIRVQYARIHTLQESCFRANITAALQVIQLSEFGDIDPSIDFEFESLWEVDDAARATIQKTKADTDAVLMAAGVIDNEEARQRVASDTDSPYHGLEGEAPEPESIDLPEEYDDREDVDPEGGAEDEFKEGDHPRAKNGQFSSGDAEELPRKGQIDLPSGGKIDVSRIRLAVGKKIGAKAIRYGLRSKTDLSPEDVEHVASRIEAAPGIKERQEAEKLLNDPAAIKAAREKERDAYEAEEQYRRASIERSKATAEKILSSPGAGLWSKKDRDKVEVEVRTRDYEAAIDEAKFATLAAVEKIATEEMGFKLRHVSASRGRPDSRYLVYTHENGDKTEVRLSNHEVPETFERFERNSTRWEEIIVDKNMLQRSREEWLAALKEAVGIKA